MTKPGDRVPGAVTFTRAAQAEKPACLGWETSCRVHRMSPHPPVVLPACSTMCPWSEESDTATSASFLRAQNQQLTERRRTIWAIMCSEGGQLTAGQVTEKTRRRDPDIDRATVDRALNLFADMGSALQTPAGQEGEPRWEIVDRGEHVHPTCELCGDIRRHTGVLAERVRDHLAERYAFSATQMGLKVFGVCQRCGTGPES